MTFNNDVHNQFAVYFEDKTVRCFAYLVSKQLEEGHICVDLDKDSLEAAFKNLPDDIKGELTELNPKTLEENPQWITTDENAIRPFVIKNDMLYLHRYFQYETKIIDNIKRLGDNFRIITGGPGTGKTYSVASKLLELFSNNINLKVALAAPTGKAAARMNESIKNFAAKRENNISEEVKEKLTGLKAKTIHRLLGTINDSVFFRFNENNYLPFDVLIIDECSMVDVAMLAKLLNAVNNNAKLFLLGDKDQLASVEAGSVFGDMCRAKDHKLLKGKVELKTESWRFDSTKGIGKFSQQVISGTFKDIESFKNDDELTIDTNYSNELFEEYAILYREYIEETEIRLALQHLNKIRFLCVTRENEMSVSKVNKQIQYYLSQKIVGFAPKSEGFYHNQPIIITQNDYQLEIFNGDVGLIRKEGETLFAFFESTNGEIKKIQAAYLNNYNTVFAMTIHKSQGSEFENVVVILPEKQGEKLLTRELLYTGVTRAKTKVLLQTSEEVLQKCVERSVSRASGLAKRLKSEE